MRGLLEQTAKVGSIGLAAQGISAVGAAAAGAAAGLAPLSGALAAYPALLSTAGQAMGVWKLRPLGVTDAVGGLNEKLDKSSDKFKELTPAAQKFVVQLDAMKKPVVDLQRTAQEGLFPGLESGLKSISGLLPVVRPIIRDTAVAMGELAEQAGKMFGSKAWRDDIKRVGDNNVTVIERLGNAGLSMANVLRDITVEAQPLVGWLTKTGEGFAATAEKMSAASRESGGMNRFFAETRIAVDRVFRIVSDLSGVLVNVGRIAYQTIGKELIGDLTRAADEFRKWSESAKGENAIRRFFLDAEPAIREAASLTKDVVVAFAELGSRGSGRAVAQDGADGVVAGDHEHVRQDVEGLHAGVPELRDREREAVHDDRRLERAPRRDREVARHDHRRHQQADRHVPRAWGRRCQPRSLPAGSTGHCGSARRSPA